MGNNDRSASRAFAGVTALFFIWGAVTSVNDVLVPAVKSIFALSDTEAFLTQFAFFLAYGVVSLPAAAVAGRLGPSRSILAALAVMVVGCALMPVATTVHAYVLVLVALFVIASGITLLQVAANPLSVGIGPPERSHYRLVLSQAFNSVGTVVGPLLAAHTLLRGGLFDGGPVTPAKIEQSLGRIDLAYAAVAIVIVLLGVLLFQMRRLLDAAAIPTSVDDGGIAGAFRSPWAVAGAGAIFLYVGAEVAIGSGMVNFLEQGDILAASPVHAGSLVSLYWFGALVGRFGGSAVLSMLPAARVLEMAALMAAVLCLVVSLATGPVAGVLALSIGLFNSIMFPVIFSLTLERSTASASATAGLLCTAIVGGAVVPLVFARVADAATRSAAFGVPLVCYLAIAVFAWRALRARVVTRATPVPVAGH